MNVFSINLNAIGASKDPNEAFERAALRLVRAAKLISDGHLPTDPGVSVRSFDPGGGPCQPQKIAIEIIIDADVLPEAKSRDDD